MGIFPDDGPIITLVGVLLAEQADEWPIGRRYTSLEAIAGALGRYHPPVLIGHEAA